MSNDIRYNRPNEKWECGWKRKGFSCHVGPNEKGSCPKKGECSPKKTENGYECTRLPQYGGKCHGGPMPDGSCCKQFPPCSPQRSLRAKRTLLVQSTLILSAAILLLSFGGAFSVESFLSPGPLSTQHSSFSNDCSACHTTPHSTSASDANFKTKALGWILNKKDSQRALAESSNKCLSCHSMGELPKNPHNLSDSELKSFLADKAPINKNASKKMECMSCHKEHHGNDFNIASLSDNQCQTCHNNSFNSFSKGHPDFKSYPFSEKIHILFDHTSHFSKHFPQKNKTGTAISCNNCHSLSKSGSKMIVKDFSQTCAQCHSEQIGGEKAINKGVVFIRLPTLDVDTIQNKGIKIGSWPEDTDGELTPFMKVLLMSDEKAKAALDFISENEVELDDLEDADTETLETVKTLVWSVKHLLHDLVDEGSNGIKDKLESILEKDLGRVKATKLINALSVDILRSITSTWFKKIKTEVEKSKDGKFASTWIFPTSEEDDDEEESSDEDWMATGGWYKDHSDFTLRYRPKGHADHFLHEWLELSGTHAKKHDSIEEIFKELSHPKDSPGACMKCHGVNPTEESFKSHWQGRTEQHGIQDFVKFSHKPHLNLIQSKGCFTCHQMDSKADFKKNRKNGQFASNFLPIKKDACVTCHQSGKVKENCLTCHNYHVGDFLSSESKMKTINTKMNKETKTTETPQGESTDE